MAKIMLNLDIQLVLCKYASKQIIILKTDIGTLEKLATIGRTRITTIIKMGSQQTASAVKLDASDKFKQLSLQKYLLIDSFCKGSLGLRKYNVVVFTVSSYSFLAVSRLCKRSRIWYFSGCRPVFIVTRYIRQ